VRTGTFSEGLPGFEVFSDFSSFTSSSGATAGFVSCDFAPEASFSSRFFAPAIV
jgi:hypothetical protein